MAAAVTYTNFGGMLVHEDRGGVERQYVGDPLGSLVGELDEDQNLTYTAEYWPYGEVRTESGNKQSEWGYVGLLGYLKDLATLMYIRARHYLPHKARWLTVDQIWPTEAPYDYANLAPISLSDTSGQKPAKKGCKVWICHRRDILGHACVVVEGPQGGCSYSSYHDGVTTCFGSQHDPKEWDCDLISTDCNYAGHVCACIFESQGDNWLPYVCWGNARNKLCCGCHRLREPQRSICEANECPPSAQRCPKPVYGGYGGAGIGGKPCI